MGGEWELARECVSLFLFSGIQLELQRISWLVLFCQVKQQLLQKLNQQIKEPGTPHQVLALIQQ